LDRALVVPVGLIEQAGMSRERRQMSGVVDDPRRGRIDEAKSVRAPPSEAALRREVLLISAPAMIAVATMVSFTRVADLAGTRKAVSIGESLLWDATSILAIGLMLPLVSWLARRFTASGANVWRNLLIHAAATIPFSLAHVLMMGLFRMAAYAVAGRGYDPLHLLHEWLYEYRKDVVIYAAIVGFEWGWRALRSAAAPRSPPAEAPLLEVRDGARRTFVRPDDILWIEAAGNYAELHLAGRTLLHRTSLASLQQRLAPAGLVRIHRARLVNRAQIASLTTNAAGDFTVTLRDGATLSGSRRYRAGLAVSGTA
jgi:hypothetical protein